jgi:peroxiredoxin
MESNSEAVGRWVEARVAMLEPGSDWHPDVAGGLARLHDRPRRDIVHARKWLWAASATAAAGATLMSFPAPRALAERCWQCVAALAPSISSPGAALTAAAARKAAPGFALRDASGSEVKLSDFEGQVVLLDFWATWCPPCKIEIPWFVEMQRDYKARGFVVLGVSLDEDGWTAVRPFLEEQRVNYRVMIGDDQLWALYGGIEALPTTFLIDRRGRIASVHSGLASRDQFRGGVERLLDEKQ